MNKENVCWWGVFRVPTGTAKRWTIGPLTLHVQRLADEWRVASQTADDPFASEVTVAEKSFADRAALFEMGTAARTAQIDDSEEIALVPALPDRSVVTSSERPLTVLPGEKAAIFVSSPLWVRLERPDGDLLEELPIYRPSDTWFGPNTRQGELCYASRTTYRTSVELIPALPHRAITEVEMDNQAGSPIRVDRMQLPVKHLSVFLAADGRLRTEDVVFRRGDAQDLAELKLREGIRTAAGSAAPEKISGPRERPQGNLAIRAFGSIFK
ncbi:MAG: hypothetical protein R6V85_08800 [Polyangia bacterium]